MVFVLCENLQADFKRCLDKLEIEDIQVITYPPYCSILSQPEEQGLNEMVEDWQAEDVRVVSCSTCVICAQAETLGLETITFDHIMSLLIDGAYLQEKIRQGFYLVSTGWLEHRREYLDRFEFPEAMLKDWFRVFAQGAVYINGFDDVHHRAFFEFCEETQLSGEIVNVRYDYLKLFIKSQYARWRATKDSNQQDEEIRSLMEKASNYAVMFEVINEVATVTDERELVDLIIQKFELVFAARLVTYYSRENDQINAVYPDLWNHIFLETETGFLIVIESDHQVFGCFKIESFFFPELKQRYIDFAVNVSKVLGMAILNLRNMQVIRKMGTHDALTGLYNRSKYEGVLKDRESKGLAGTAILVVDIDNLKEVNDSLGHEMGDRLIISMAEVLEKSSRNEDEIFRIGGDEFVMLIHAQDVDVCELIARRLLRNLKIENDQVLNQAYSLSFSYGFDIFKDTDATNMEAFKRADLAMYQMKKAKKARSKLNG